MVRRILPIAFRQNDRRTIRTARPASTPTIIATVLPTWSSLEESMQSKLELVLYIYIWPILKGLFILILLFTCTSWLYIIIWFCNVLRSLGTVSVFCLVCYSLFVFYDVGLVTSWKKNISALDWSFFFLYLADNIRE